MQLTHCARCRVPAPSDAPCARCGYWTRVPGSASGALPGAAPSTGRGARPLGVTIIAALSLVTGVLGIVGAVALGDTAVEAPAATDLDVLLNEWLGPLVPVVTVAFALANLVVGVGLLRGVRWAWTAELVLVGVALLEGVVRLSMRQASALLTIALGLFVAMYFASANVKRWFGVPVADDA